MRLVQTTLLIASLTLCACDEDGVVGEEGGRSPDPSSTEQDQCYEVRELSEIPSTFYWYKQSPSATVESARGTFRNSKGDKLTIDIHPNASSSEYVCYDDPIIPPPAGTRPYVELSLSATATLQTADGAWNEVFEVPFVLSETSFDGEPIFTNFAGNTTLPLADLGGSFVLPADLPEPASSVVNVGLAFRDAAWKLNLAVRAERKQNKCTCADLEPPTTLWKWENAVFLKRG